jgi:hypothetical protein
MTNRSKRKGDEGEREAVQMLLAMAPDIVHPAARRALGAGRKDDIGDVDIRTLTHVVIQVKKPNRANFPSYLRLAAKGAVTQRQNAIAQYHDIRWGLGLVPIPLAPMNGAVRWLACVDAGEWPGPLPDDLTANGGPFRFNAAGKMVAWLKTEKGPHGFMAFPREQRIATYGLVADDSIIVAPVEAWLAAYRLAVAALAGAGACQAA